MHIYTDENKSVCLPSVTSILSFVKIKDEYESLIKWSNSLGFKHMNYNTTLSNAADFGTIVHESISHILNHEDIPVALENKVSFNDIDKYNMTINNFIKYCNTTNMETFFSEKSLLSEKLGYGGTIDWLAKENNAIVLTDFKTSSDYREYMLLQLSAYTKLIEDQTDYKIDYARIMLVSTKSFTIKTFTKKELEDAYPKFDLRFQMFKMYTEQIDTDSNENSLIIVK